MEGLRACVHVYEGHIACITVDLAINTHCPERYRNNWLTCYFLFDFAAFMYIYPFVIMSSQLPGPYSTMFTTKVIILSLIYRSPVFTPVFFFSTSASREMLFPKKIMILQIESKVIRCSSSPLCILAVCSTYLELLCGLCFLWRSNL